MKPKKKIIDAAIANGSIDRLNMLLSAAHLLNCEANNLSRGSERFNGRELPSAWRFKKVAQ